MAPAQTPADAAAERLPIRRYRSSPVLVLRRNTNDHPIGHKPYTTTATVGPAIAADANINHRDNRPTAHSQNPRPVTEPRTAGQSLDHRVPPAGR